VTTESSRTVGTVSSHVLVEDLTRTQIVQYAGASGDYNPLHTDERYAVEVAGYPSVFAHGMLTAGMTGEAVRAFAGKGFVRSFGGRFLAQVWPGDSLRVDIEVGANEPTEGGSIVGVLVTTRNQRDERVFAGSAEIVFSSATDHHELEGDT
jgi:acyl dehydratase